MKRLHQFILIASFVPLCWILMMGVHELGHVLAGWLTGGSINRIVLHPFAISRTDVFPNPMPLIVVWTGPIVGVIVPLLIWAVWYIARVPGEYLTRFFAGFCLVANGAYIGVGSFDGMGDAGEMIRHGTSVWLLWLFGLFTVPVGFLLWHRLGPHFGFGDSHGRVDEWAAYTCLTLAVVTFLVALGLSPYA